MLGTDSQKYTVQYTAGACGTLLTWFVNQHQNFPGGDFKVAPEYDVALRAKSLQWRVESTDWTTVLSNLQDEINQGKIQESSTVCFKTFPHDLIHDIEDQDLLDQTIKNFLKAGVTQWIYPVFYKQSNYQYENSRVANRKYQVIANRHQEADWIADKNSGFRSIFQTQDLHSLENTKLSNVVKKYNIDTLFLDMAALLGADDDEYNQMVEFLNTERLTNWHSVLMSSVQFWDMPYA